jgi:glycosyltransferase involved in cell wall biosynthesis
MILHLTSFLRQEFGGPVSALIGLCSAQVQLGMELALVAVENQPNALVVARLEQAGVHVFVERGITAYGWSSSARNTLQRLVPAAQAMHIHGVWEHAQHLGISIARRFSKPAVIRPCGMLDAWSLSQQRLKKAAYMALRLRRNLRRASAIHCTSGAERDAVQALGFRTPVLVEPNGVDVAEINAAARGEFRSRHRIASASPIVLFLGRLHPKKGVHLLLEAFAKIRNQNAVLAVAGSGESSYTSGLRAACDALHINHRTIFTGELRGLERSAAYVDADLFVLPSHQENFANSVVEAVAASTPVVVSGGVALHSEVNAFQVGSICTLEPIDIASQIDWWLEHPEQRQAVAERAGQFCARFDWASIARRWQEHYGALAQAKSVRP